ncbi:MAG: LysR substrate-binding domain-containing protein [Thiobacillus sp.]|jgi:DNA-binding transcriptional LysR family regulator|nr:LysR family transcriptional regulator [Gammaproteobacteria bacterium]OYZ27900.1 MAG: LysR family transcriptional regulator [Hydrogenophilales bacterium 16-64-40]OZA33523.1 MAG: LysR family transcriptional regulator [Hydrogenophilales bacterium 17-64-65]HQT32610.1 LysR substrate-binding domain-containing protein [Thiobacillus sp.]
MRRLTLRQFRVFEAVARHLSFSRAAEELHLSQPAVSMQVKGIETILGMRLTEQLGKKIFLTEAGREVLHASRTITARLDDMQANLAQLRSIDSGRLSLAATSTVNVVATDILARFRGRHPGVTVHLDVSNRAAVLDQLIGNRIDLAIMGQVPDGLGLEAIRFMDNPLVVIAPPDHPLVGKKNASVASLAAESFLVREAGSGTRGAMERFFAARELEIQSSMEMSSNEAIKQAVQAGLGLGILSLQTLEMELALKRLAVLDVDGFPIMRHWYIVHRADKRLSPAALAFKDFVLGPAQARPRKG